MRERLPHAGGGARKVQLSRLDASCLGGGVDVERVFFGGEAETVPVGPGSAVLGGLAARTTTVPTDFVFFLDQQVLEGGGAGR